ncbi:hypothetical protein [Nocardia sp. alder85J]|uniref:hypothetical protein n=1 Tax=Nocardia sp. alder85J TaxID=2862949 RepID=UPI001CD1E161|nr:hypothetical protein [Nocardia sp. alder85J]MCX4095339.1 hypothetical protein [Nocardia sp. alder85J]
MHFPDADARRLFRSLDLLSTRRRLARLAPDPEVEVALEYLGRAMHRDPVHDVISTAEAARLLDLSPRHVRELGPVLGAVRLTGRALWYRREMVEEYARTHRKSPT